MKKGVRPCGKTYLHKEFGKHLSEVIGEKLTTFLKQYYGNMRNPCRHGISRM